ncbi:MAG: SUMF1/EgtB/PvdO family nonheme iron enzyme [Deltaproteobacteria bacterium]|nr:SUMF1/EgtB/PvdO family nonheme iron enzyme [Deltaproteobacteria bacterium]
MMGDTVRWFAALLLIGWTTSCGGDVAADGGEPDADSTDVATEATPDSPDETDAPDGEDAPDAENPCPAGMTLVPAGPFRMGSDPGEGQTDELPEHEVLVSAFCIDLVEVTNAAYRACDDEGSCPGPLSRASWTRRDYYTSAAYDDYPVVYVDWGSASAFCASLGKRLPTEAEWEKAARGGCELVAPAGCGPEDERSHPWGDETPTCDLANFERCVGDTDRTGTRPAGDGPYGNHDMVGNVWEWVGDYYDIAGYADCAAGCADPTGPATGSARTLRGGSWRNAPDYVRAPDRFGMDGESPHDFVGFRCAADP